MYKKVVLISTFCDTDEKISVLRENIKIIKSLGLDVICISPFALDKDLMNSCDYFLLTKDNPILEWPIKAIGIWKKVSTNNKTVTLSVAFPDYGFAGLSQVKQLSELAINLNYNQFYHIIYDTKIDDIVCDAFKSNLTNSIYGSKRENILWRVGLHLMVFNRENLLNLISEINLDSYLSNKSYDAFEWLHNVAIKLNITLEDKYVEDHITYRTKYDFFNVSPIKETKFFIFKNNESELNVKLYFYDVTDNNIKIFIDKNEIYSTIHESQECDLGFRPNENKEVFIYHNKTQYDITHIIKELKHSDLKYE